MKTEMRHFATKQEFEAYQSGILDCCDALKRKHDDPHVQTQFALTVANEANGWEVLVMHMQRSEGKFLSWADIKTNAIAGENGCRGVR